MSSAEGLIFLNENFGFGLMSKIRLRSYSGMKVSTNLGFGFGIALKPTYVVNSVVHYPLGSAGPDN